MVVTLILMLGTVGIALAITNGEPDGDRHPYVGFLVFDVYVPGFGNVPAWFCSGTLIAPDVVLTAGHCTYGAAAARIWFDELFQDENGNFLVPDFPWGGVVAVEGTPYTHPDFCIGCGKGLPAFDFRDIGVVVLDEPVDVGGFAQLPTAGLVDTLKNKTDIDIVGYGVQWQEPGGGLPPYYQWRGLLARLYAPSETVSGEFSHSDEFLKISLNPGGGTGGVCFGDSGGPDLLGDTDTVLAVNSYSTNNNCAGVGYSSRVDIPEVLEWIEGFLE